MVSKRLSSFLSFKAVLEAQHMENVFVDNEKIERPKRLSRLFSFPVLKESVKESVFEDEEVESETGEKRSQQLSQLLSFTKEEQSGLDNDYEVLAPDERKEIRAKRARRFSSLFAGASADSSNEEFSLSGEGDDSKVEQPRTREDIATMVFKLFHVRDSRKGSRHKRNTSTRIPASFKPRRQESKLRKAKKDKKQRDIKITLYLKPFWKRQKQDPQATKATHDADTSSLTPSVVKKSRKSNHQRSTSVCDSKFSSISSALSFTSLPTELRSITTSQCTILLHLLHKVTRSLQHQERLTANFSSNLAHLFARKERTIDGNKRLSKEFRKILIGMMTGLRELVGRTFLKKAVFMQRSLQLTNDLEEMLVAPQREEGGRDSLEVNSETTLVGTTPPLDAGRRMSVIIEELNSSAVSLPAPSQQHHIDIHNFQHALHILRADIDVQMQLDQALRAGIVGPCEDVRFPATTNERIAMRRFVAFVDGCLMHLGRNYVQEGSVVKVLDVLVGVLRDGGS